MKYRVSYLMDENWERAVETALDGQTDPQAIRTLTLDGAVKCVQGRLPPPKLLERFQNLEHLSIANIGVSSLEQFPRLVNLQTLILSDNRIAGGLEFLVQAGLDSLRDLDLSNNRIQFMEDLAPLAQLKLVSLDLYECPVTRLKDYRPRVFGLIKSLKYLDKMDAEENERPESDEEDEEDGDEEDDNEEDDPGSCEIDVGERPNRMINGHSERVEGVVEVDDEEESEADEEETETERRANGVSHQANRFRLEPVNVDDEEDDNEEENESGEEIDEEDGENDDNVVEVHEIEDSDDKEDGVEDEEYEDEDVEGVDDDEGDFRGRQRNGLLMSTDGEIDGHEQGEDDDGYDDGETGEEEQGVEDGEEEVRLSNYTVYLLFTFVIWQSAALFLLDFRFIAWLTA